MLTRASSKRWLRAAGVLAGYGVLFVLFDVQAAAFEIAPGVSLWYPSAGLNLALLLIFGLRYLPAVLVATLASGLFISDPAIAWPQLVGPVLAVVLGCGAAAALLRDRFAERDPASVRGIYWFAAVALTLPIFVGAASVLSYTLTGMEGYTWSRFLNAVLGWWRGDAVGILTLTPLLFGTLAPYTRDWQHLFEQQEDLSTRLTSLTYLLEGAAQIAAIGLALYLTFYTFTDPFHYYFCFLPLLWMALHHGLWRATFGIFLTNLGVFLTLASLSAAGHVFEVQLFTIALALTGLLLGALVSERRHAVRSLRQAHRLLTERLRQHTASPAGSTARGAPPGPTQNAAGDTLQRYIKQLQEDQQQLADTSEQLQDSNKHKDEFFSLIAHDLKNLIMSSIYISEVLVDDAHTLEREEIQEFAGHLATSSQRTYDLLENLMAWTHLETGQVSCEPVLLSAAQFVQENLQLVEENARRKDLALRSDVPDALHLRADSHMANTILRNLLFNAIKYTEAGGEVTVTASGEEQSVRFAVIDTGVGIEPERLGHLFSVGRLRSTPGTDEEPGTGLGLLLCSQMVQQHDGRLWAESTPGQGSTFFFTLPRARDSRAPATPDPERTQAALSAWVAQLRRQDGNAPLASETDT